MKVEKLTLKNFRNVEDSTFYPDRTVNFLIGSNGQGKTSFIEALGFLSTLRSFRDSKTSHVIRWGTQASDISCSLTSGTSDEWKTELRVAFQIQDETRQKASKIASVNGKHLRSSTQYLSQRFGSYELGFHTVIFNPSDHDLVRGDPATRRSYLDRVIAAEDVEYLKALQKYQRTLVQRNALLKSGNVDKSIWLGFTEPLCQLGSYLVYKRLQWLQKLEPVLDSSLKKLVLGESNLKLVYLSNWAPKIENLSFNNNNLNSIHFAGQGHLPSLELIEQSFWTKISALDTTERRTGHSLVGPHRDDWAFILNGQALKGHGSQGEVRSALLALKLAEIELFRNETGHRPLFLLDDFSSELDRERRAFLLRFLLETDLQTFVTTTEDSSFLGKRYWVSNGAVKEGMHDDRTKSV